MKFSYSTGNLIFLGFLIILLILPIFDRHKIGKFQTQKSLLGIRLWAITYLPMERARCLPQINAIKFWGNPAEKIFERQTKRPLRSKHAILSRHSKVVKSIKMLYWPDFSKALCFWAILFRLDIFALLLPNHFTYNASVGSQKPNFNGRWKLCLTAFRPHVSKLTTSWIHAHKRTNLSTFAYITMYKD